MFVDGDEDEDKEDGQAHRGPDSLQVQEGLRYASFAFLFEFLPLHDVARLVVVVSQDRVRQQVHKLLHLVSRPETELGNFVDGVAIKIFGVLPRGLDQLYHLLPSQPDFISRCSLRHFEFIIEIDLTIVEVVVCVIGKEGKEDNKYGQNLLSSAKAFALEYLGLNALDNHHPYHH